MLKRRRHILLIALLVCLAAQTAAADSFKDLVNRTKMAVGAVGGRLYENTDWVMSVGTGFAITDSGFMLTNFHVIANLPQIYVTFPFTPEGGHKTYAAIIVSSGGQHGLDDDTPNGDWALLKLFPLEGDEEVKVPSLELSPANPEDSLYHEIATLGYPATGLEEEVGDVTGPAGNLGFRVAHGYVERVLRFGPGQVLVEIPTGTVEHGNSGGPLFDLETGKVIGINSLLGVLDNYGQYSFTHNYAIPITAVLGQVMHAVEAIQEEQEMDADELEDRALDYVASSRFEDADRVAGQLLEKNPDSALGHLARAGWYEQRRMWDDAFTHIEAAQRAAPRSTYLATIYASYKLEREGPEAVIEYLKAVLQDHPDDWPEGYALLAKAYTQVGMVNLGKYEWLAEEYPVELGHARQAAKRCLEVGPEPEENDEFIPSALLIGRLAVVFFQDKPADEATLEAAGKYLATAWKYLPTGSPREAECEAWMAGVQLCQAFRHLSGENVEEVTQAVADARGSLAGTLAKLVRSGADRDLAAAPVHWMRAFADLFQWVLTGQEDVTLLASAQKAALDLVSCGQAGNDYYDLGLDTIAETTAQMAKSGGNEG